MMTEEIRHATPGNDHIKVLSHYVMHGWPSTRAEVLKEIQPYWSSRDEVAVIDRIAMKGRRIIMPVALHRTTLKQLHVRNVGIEKTRLLTCKSICCVNINTDIENAIKIA